PPGQRHAVGWRNRAIFVNLHIGTALPDEKMGRLLAAVSTVGETHVVSDSFLSAFGENILVLASNRVVLDGTMMRALRLMVVAHIVKTYAPDHVLIETFPANAGLDVDVALGDNDQQVKVAARELAQWQLRKVTSAIESDLRQDRSVAELAEMVNLSKGHFS